MTTSARAVGSVDRSLAPDFGSVGWGVGGALTTRWWAALFLVAVLAVPARAADADAEAPVDAQSADAQAVDVQLVDDGADPMLLRRIEDELAAASVLVRRTPQPSPGILQVVVRGADITVIAARRESDAPVVLLVAHDDGTHELAALQAAEAVRDTLRAHRSAPAVAAHTLPPVRLVAALGPAVAVADGGLLPTLQLRTVLGVRLFEHMEPSLLLHVPTVPTHMVSGPGTVDVWFGQAALGVGGFLPLTPRVALVPGVAAGLLWTHGQLQTKASVLKADDAVGPFAELSLAVRGRLTPVLAAFASVQGGALWAPVVLDLGAGEAARAGQWLGSVALGIVATLPEPPADIDELVRANTVEP